MPNLFFPTIAVVLVLGLLLTVRAWRRAGALPTATRRRRRALLVAPPAFLIGAVGYGGFVEPREMRYRRTALRPPRWPAEQPPLRLLVVADPHVGCPSVDVARLRRMAARCAALRPDVVLCAGDLVTSELDDGAEGARIAREAAAAIASIPSRHGTFAVYGNHDRRWNAPKVAAAWAAAGVPLLVNRGVRLRSGGSGAPPLWLCGTDDLWTGDCDPERSIAAAPRDATIVLCSHNPDGLLRTPDRVALTVSGHTHGGQVSLPFVGPIAVGAEHRFARGHVVDRGRHLFVSSGIGTSVAPIRIGVPPEVVLLELGAGSTRPS